jgi:hypothetical protein
MELIGQQKYLIVRQEGRGGIPSGWTDEIPEADDRIRTYDLLITNQLLYRLSYVGVAKSCRYGSG